MFPVSAFVLLCNVLLLKADNLVEPACVPPLISFYHINFMFLSTISSMCIDILLIVVCLF